MPESEERWLRRGARKGGLIPQTKKVKSGLFFFAAQRGRREYGRDGVGRGEESSPEKVFEANSHEKGKE